MVQPTEGAFSRDAVQHLRGACPTLPARSQDNRLLRRGHDVIVAVGQHRAHLLDGTTSPCEALAGMGMATRNLKRRGRLRPHDLAGFRTCLAIKLGLHTFCLWLNVHLGRPPLAFADVIAS